jgi:hypothetical protein
MTKTTSSTDPTAEITNQINTVIKILSQLHDTLRGPRTAPLDFKALDTARISADPRTKIGTKKLSYAAIANHPHFQELVRQANELHNDIYQDIANGVAAAYHAPGYPQDPPNTSQRYLNRLVPNPGANTRQTGASAYTHFTTQPKPHSYGANISRRRT